MFSPAFLMLMALIVLINIVVGGFLLPRNGDTVLGFLPSRIWASLPHYNVTIPVSIVCGFAAYFMFIALLDSHLPALLGTILIRLEMVEFLYVPSLIDYYIVQPMKMSPGDRKKEALEREEDAVYASNKNYLKLFPHSKVAKRAWDLADSGMGYLRFTMTGIYSLQPLGQSGKAQEQLVCEYSRPLKNKAELDVLSEQFCKQYNNVNRSTDDAEWHISNHLWQGNDGPYRMLVIYGKYKGERLHQWQEFYRLYIPNFDQYPDNKGFHFVTYTEKDIVDNTVYYS